MADLLQIDKICVDRNNCIYRDSEAGKEENINCGKDGYYGTDGW